MYRWHVYVKIRYDKKQLSRPIDGTTLYSHSGELASSSRHETQPPRQRNKNLSLTFLDFSHGFTVVSTFWGCCLTLTTFTCFLYEVMHNRKHVYTCAPYGVADLFDPYHTHSNIQNNYHTYSFGLWAQYSFSVTNSTKMFHVLWSVMQSVCLFTSLV